MTHVYQVLLSSGTAINQLETKVSLKTICWPGAICCCLQTCNVAAFEEMWVERCVPSLIVINSTINQLEYKVSLITTCCLRLFVVVYKVEIVAASEVMV